LVKEISLVSADREPAEPMARVLTLREAQPASPPPEPDRYWPESDPVWREIWHRVEDLGEDFDTVFREMKEREERQRRPSRRVGCRELVRRRSGSILHVS
jgi:hypothetical protein